VLNVKRPWPVAARHTVGHMLPDVVFGCLHQVMPRGVQAEGAPSLWNPQIVGGGSLVDEVEEGTDANSLPEFSTVIFHCGGAGARPTKDGLSVTAFPSGVRTIPIEATESVARGRDGGKAGAPGVVSLRSGRPIRPKGRQTVPPRDAIRLELPGGGGFGDARARDPERVCDDVLDGLITAEDARRDYGVAVDGQGRLDLEEVSEQRRMREGELLAGERLRGESGEPFRRGPHLLG
jgi:N-methylhydantoinase B